MPYIPEINVGSTTYKVKDTDGRALISDLESKLDYVNNTIGTEAGAIPYIHWIKGKRIQTNLDTVDRTVMEDYAGMNCCVIPCQEGDEFKILATSTSSTYRPWCFIDSTGVKKTIANSNAQDMLIKAPIGAEYLVCNARNTMEYSLVFLNNNVSDLKAAVDSLEKYLGLEPIPWIEKGCVASSTEPITPSAWVATNNYDYCVVSCSAGEVFHIYTSGANTSYRPWTFIDSNGAILAQATSNSQNTIIKAPTNTAYLVCNATHAGEKRLTRVTNGEITPQLFGAVGDGVTDDTAAFQRAIESGFSIYVPSRRNEKYLITETLTIAKGYSPKIYGDGNYTKHTVASIIFDLTDKYNSGTSVSTLRKTALFNITNLQMLRIHGVAFDCKTVAGSKVGLFLKAQTDLVDYDIDITNCSAVSFYRFVAFKGRGFTLLNCNLASMMYIGYFDWDDAVDTNHNHPAEYDQRAIRFQNNRMHHISKGYIYIQSGHAYGLVFSGNVMDNGSGYLLRANNEAYNWNVTGNLYQGISTEEPIIRFGGGARNCLIANNTLTSDLSYWLSDEEDPITTTPVNWLYSDAKLEYCTIIGNNCKNCKGAAIYLNNAEYNVISSNIFRGIGASNSGEEEEDPDEGDESEDLDPEILQPAMIEITGTVTYNTVIGNIATGTNVTLLHINAGASSENNQIYANIPNA